MKLAWDDVLHIRDAHGRVGAAAFEEFCQATMGRIEIALHPQPPPADRAEHHDAVDSDPGRDPGLKPKMNPAPCEDALEDRILQAAGHLRFVYPAGEVGVDSRAWAEVARLRHQGLSWVLEWVRAGHATPPPWLRVGEGQTL